MRKNNGNLMAQIDCMLGDCLENMNTDKEDDS